LYNAPIGSGITYLGVAYGKQQHGERHRTRYRGPVLRVQGRPQKFSINARCFCGYRDPIVTNGLVPVPETGPTTHTLKNIALVMAGGHIAGKVS